MSFMAQITSHNPHPGCQRITNAGRPKSRMYDYRQDLSPEATYPARLVRLYPLRMFPVLVHGFKISQSPLLVATCGCPMHTGARLLVLEFQVVRDPRRHLETRSIAMGRYPERHLHGFVAFPVDPGVHKLLTFHLHLDLKDWDILKIHRAPVPHIIRVGDNHLRLRMNREFLGCHQRMAHRDC